jgi:hypothetical protein
MSGSVPSSSGCAPATTIARLGKQIAEVAAALNSNSVGFALIGGLALASHKVVRATQDFDLLAQAERADDIDARLTQLGYRCLQPSRNAANCACGDERVDFLYASRPIARQPGDARHDGIARVFWAL